MIHCSMRVSFSAEQKFDHYPDFGLKNPDITRSYVKMLKEIFFRVYITTASESNKSIIVKDNVHTFNLETLFTYWRCPSNTLTCNDKGSPAWFLFLHFPKAYHAWMNECNQCTYYTPIQFFINFIFWHFSRISFFHHSGKMENLTTDYL